MKLSIIIPTFNESAVISDCLHSLLSQDYKSFEIIVVDDGSTDNTEQIVTDISKETKLLTVLKQKHLGAGSARNLGAKHATGDILVFVDADMTFDTGFIRELVMPITKENVVGTFSKNERVSNWDNVWSRCWNWNFSLPDGKRLPNTYPDHQKVFRAIKKSAFTSVNGFTAGGYTDDWSLSEKLQVEAVNAPNALFYHQNPDTLSEVFTQSRWSAKRPYKLGSIGFVVALFRINIVFSLIVGLFKAILHKDIRFVLFKIVYDLGQTIGIIQFYATKKGTK
ncbi:glycosyltransferase family 2 protein [Candidatus Woesebacteria bacterium]|nr:glycosyltransferase family 2 protein [Candidatus Woesebacteria bacterium]